MIPLYMKFPTTKIMKPATSIKMAPVYKFSQTKLGLVFPTVLVMIILAIHTNKVLDTSAIDLYILLITYFVAKKLTL